ncbi:MAG: Threonine dehydratase, catabolic @ L-serine dehydratase, (PLP)-dependent [uncultured Pyrinomonadaceae bacterium]|uniref:Threonine dehydratase, catabolic @ L-serine dehydratase, (PLP)-dependent n=1 Tax=uncultured Pyrinomonadaceae bacterium TaxID=2283094 RepID=A0A6J4PX53_9BACT|nr:MAG: Threonine dehydratase, catabolic @ L-serine dehydratase, (PLP)-dependent [uncultured Pyrinomonadaceae bacterium]
MTVKLSDIEDAQTILQNIIIPTPTLADSKLARVIGTDSAYLKAECLQKGGSFKVRGAYNKISRLSDDEKRRGVVAASAGNHAQGVALAARLHDTKATIVLPEFAPLTKITATKNYGAEVVLHGATFDEALARSKELQEEHGYTYVHAFDDERVIAGQGTIGLEIARDVPQVTVIVVPIGGGGLISGVAIAAKSILPEVRIVGVQSEMVAPVKGSLAAGKPVAVEVGQTIADGIAVKHPGAITLPLIREFVDEVVEVSEEEIAQAIFFAVQNNRLVVEGAGAAGLAALLAGKVNLKKEDAVCAVLCGGNIDPNLLARVLEQVMVRRGRYIMLKLLVIDRPGTLARLLDHTAESGANVIEVFHRRAMWLAPLGRVGIEMLLEVRDEQHGREVLKHLRETGYHVEREGVGDWEE